MLLLTLSEPRHKIFNNVVCATNKGSNQCLSDQSLKLLTEHHLEFLSLKRGQTGLSESTLVKMPHVGCPPVRGDNQLALAFYVKVDKHGITILYHLHQCKRCTSQDI